MAVELLARAKINLALHVTGRRADGYHLLDSLVAFAECGDRLRLAKAQALSLTLTGPRAAGLSAGPDNLVWRAAGLMGRGAAITLEKHLPIASGIGGGSADAAATLLGLARLYDLALPPADQVLALGADLPICLAGRPARMTGIGEEIAPLTLPPGFVLLVNPGFGLSTPAVFRALTQRDNPPMPAPARWRDLADLVAYLRLCRNDLQAPALELAPEIARVLQAIAAQPGCALARMSGSGATCFGLFEHEAPAEAAAKAISLTYPEYWVQAAALAG